MISVLNVIDHMGNAIGEEQVKSLQRLRERLATCLEASDVAGRAFSKEWGSLADQMARWDAKFADAKTILPGEDENRTEAIRKLWSERDSAEVPGPLRCARLSSVTVVIHSTGSIGLAGNSLRRLAEFCVLTRINCTSKPARRSNPRMNSSNTC
jgi:hypothetical protein